MKEKGSMPELEEKLKNLLSEKMQEGGTAAGFALIKEGELITALAIGTQKGDEQTPASPDSLYNVGSVSKVYCAMSVMKLVEQGKVSLDAPVCSYLPRFIMPNDRYKKITLRMCINHSSGLPGTNFNKIFTTEWLGDEYHDLTYDYLSKCKLKAEPGEFSTYCNDGFTLAELVVAEVSGMSYTEFLQKYITQPLGAKSTCTGENLPIDKLIAEKGKKEEYVTAIGSGGIVTSLTDCARFGHMFLEPQGVFTRESIDECITPQGTSNLPDNLAQSLGLGWDCVRYKSADHDFGEGTLLKSGGTTSFLSYLMVSRKHKFAAAISVTMDTKIDALAAIDEMCGLTLEELGIKARREKPDAAEVEKKAVPKEFYDKYPGNYFSGAAIFDVKIEDAILSVRKKNDDEWTDVFIDAKYDGTHFVTDKDKLLFQERDGSVYLSQVAPIGLRTLGQKPPRFPQIHSSWKMRVGKKYVLADASPLDIIAELLCETELQAPVKDGPLTLRLNGLDGTPMYCSFISTGENETDMFLNAPGSPGSRDCFAPIIWERDGLEYLYFAGYTFVWCRQLTL